MRHTRRFSPGCEPLPVRALLSLGTPTLSAAPTPAPAPRVVVDLDIDTGAGTPQVNDLRFAGIDVLALPPYLAPDAIDFRKAGTPVVSPSYDTLGWGEHGSIMASVFADEADQAGLAPLVVPLIAGDARGFSSDAIGRALEYAAAWTSAFHAACPGIPVVVSLPVNPGPAGPIERAGRAELAAEGIVLSEAAGNQGLDLDLDRLPGLVPPGSNVLVMGAVGPVSGTREPYSNAGTVATPAVISADPLGTSAAAMSGAAWAAMEEAANPGAPATQVVATLHAAGTLGLVPEAVPVVILREVPAVVVSVFPGRKPGRR